MRSVGRRAGKPFGLSLGTERVWIRPKGRPTRLECGHNDNGVVLAVPDDLAQLAR